MKYTVEYMRAGHSVPTRLHTNSYAHAVEHYDKVKADPSCSNPILSARPDPAPQEARA